ncbi:MAG: hypothetical protein K6C12_07160 [Oscillospiraceae bacterium]|nr:hypothetical protein [Oscillospiraceae bacterium]
MRRIRRLLFFGLSLALLLGLCGCGAFQTQMAKTTSRMGKLQSFHGDADIRLDTLTTVGGQDLHLSATVTGGFDFESDPLIVKTDMLLEALGRETELKYYIVKDFDTVSILPWDDDRAFRDLSLTMNAARRIKTLQALKLLIKCSDSFSEPVPDTVSGAPALRYDGIFPDEYVNEALVLLDLKEAEEAPPGPVSSEAMSGSGDSGGRAVGSTADVPLPVSGIPGSIWVGEDDMITQVEIDIASFCQDIVDEWLEELLDEYDLDGLELKTQLQSMICRITFSDFNSVEKLVLPDRDW